MNQEAYETDIAIVGAGVGGAYSAWRLRDKISAPEHQKIDLEGKRLYEYGWWSLMDWVLSREAIELINDAGGYDAPFRNWNAAVAMDVFRNNAPGWDVPSRMIATGFQSLPEALVQGFINQGGRYHSRHRLCAITPFEQQGQTRVKLVFENARGTRMVVNARHAILGLPKRSLELLDQDSVHLRTAEIQSDIDSVISKPAIKLYLGYPYPWWKVLGIRGGKSVTDLQIKQSYYFGAEEDRPAGEAGNTNALLLAAYTDGRVLDYWHPLARGNEFAGAENPFVPVGQSPLPNESRATNNQVVQAQKELKALHDLKYIPKPYTAAYMDWSQDPYGGGYSLWKPGQKSLATQKRMRHLPGLPIHICGDSYSDLQGWVEGALTSTELMLEEHFQLERPHWIEKDYLSRFAE